MKTLLLILILSMTAISCPQFVRTLHGRVTDGSQGISMMSLYLTGATTQFTARTTQLGYYRIEVTGCDTVFIFTGTSKRRAFSTQIPITQPEQELNIFIPE